MISIVVPVYNVEKYLKKCVESLVKQTVDDIEILLIDDGSTDGSGRICDELAEEYDAVKSFHKANGGLPDARNFGARQATGAWISFVDADDYVEPEYVETLLRLAETYHADMVITNVFLRDGNEPISKKNQFEEFVADKDQAFYEVYCGEKINWSGCGKLYQTETILANPFPDGYYEDFASAYKHIEACERIVISDYSFNYHYIKRNGSITAQRLSAKHFRIFEVCDELKEYIEATYPEWRYISLLIYQMAILLVSRRVVLTDTELKNLFNQYKPMFRRNVLSILKQRGIPMKSKIYNVILCTNYRVMKLVNRIL